MAQHKCQLLPCNIAQSAATQQWNIGTDSYHHITLISDNNQCLDIDDNGKDDQTIVNTQPCHPWDKDPTHQGQSWKYQNDNTIISILSSLCLDTPQPAMARVMTWIYHCNGTPQQKWLYNTSDSTIRHTSTQLCLDCGTATPAPNPCTLLPAKDLPFCDFTKTFEQRVHDLVTRLTTPEKLSLVGNSAHGIPRLNIAPYEWGSEALHGVAISLGVQFMLPTLVSTNFPQPITTASSFDRELFHGIASAISTEARAFANVGHSGLTFWAPNLNIFRDPRWGRGQETPGEDPKLTSEYVYKFVTGMQFGEDPNYLKVSSCCKHYAAYSLENWKGMDRFHFDAIVSPQDMADTYLPAFQTCIQRAKASSIMCSYNSINGIPSCANKEMLTDIARGKWGFQGYITGDCGAIDCVDTTHHYTNTSGDTCRTVLQAGTDIDCGTYLFDHLPKAIDDGDVAISEVDKALTNLFMVQYRLGLFDAAERQPYRQISTNEINSPLHQTLALSAAREGLVLLKNMNATLPLKRFKISTIAVVGPNADAPQTMQGNYYGVPPYLITPRMALAKYGSVTYAMGCDIQSSRTDGFAEAATAASKADVTIIVIGIDHTIECEGLDRVDITLPGVQDKFVSTIAAASRGPVIVVIMGTSLDLSAIKDNNKVSAIIWSGYPGQSGGQAIAETIFGDNAPAGRLPITFYRASFTDYTFLDMSMRPNKSSGNPGKTYRFYAGTPPVYEFGFGLSYTTFTYEWHNIHQLMTYNDITTNSIYNISIHELLNGGSLSCNVTNIGNIASDTSILVFIIPPNAGHNGQPLKYLADFTRINLQPRESKIVTFPMVASLFELADVNGNYNMVHGNWHIIIHNIQLTVHVPSIPTSTSSFS